MHGAHISRSSAQPPARKGVTGPGGPAVAGTVEPTVLQTLGQEALTCAYARVGLDLGTYSAWSTSECPCRGGTYRVMGRSDESLADLDRAIELS